MIVVLIKEKILNSKKLLQEDKNKWSALSGGALKYNSGFIIFSLICIKKVGKISTICGGILFTKVKDA